MPSKILIVDDLTVRYTPEKMALNSVSFSIATGEIVALIGASGAGKSTLLGHVAGLVDSHERSGSITLNGDTIQRKDGKSVSCIRRLRGSIGFIFQRFNLVSQLSVKSNVLIGALGVLSFWRVLIGWFPIEQHKLADEALRLVGLESFAFRRASTLSGGEIQRVAIARSLVQQPKIILADEPIASLDQETASRILDLLKDINQSRGTALLISLHQIHFAIEYSQRIIALQNGKVVYDGRSADLTEEEIRIIYNSVS